MPVKFEKTGDTLNALLIGEIDHHSAVEIRESCDMAIKTTHPDVLVMDFGAVSFMDSSGVGLVMGRYKLMNFICGSVVVRNASPRIEKILRLSGLEKIVEIETTIRRDVAV